MPSEAPQSRLFGLFACVLILLFVAQAAMESRLKSASSDEPPHIASGLSYIETRSFRGNLQHPPLLKELAGLSLRIGGIRWPNTPETDHLINGQLQKGEQPEWDIGNHLIADNGSDRVLAWARAPLILVAALGAVVIFLWGRQLFGGLAALGAVLLYTMDPTVIGHSYLVTTDVGVTSFILLFLYLLWNYVQAPDRRRLIWCGVALGAALCAKFSAVLLLGIAPLLMLAAVIWPIAKSKKTAPAQLAAPQYRAGRNDPCPCGSGKKFKSCHGVELAAKPSPPPAGSLFERALPSAGAFVLMFILAMVVLEVVYLFRSPFLYVEGFQRVNADHDPSYPYYFAGELQKGGTTLYFLWAWLLKEPLAAIILTVIGLVMLLRNKAMPKLLKCFVLLPPAAIFLAATAGAAQIGVRYLMPAFPFGHLLGGFGLAALLQKSARWARPLATLLCVWLVLAAAGVYPDRLSYFNESACLLRDPSKLGMDDGSRCGTLWLDDSNVDWGQSLKQLKTWLDEHAPGQTVRLLNTFGFPADAYGIRYQAVSPNDLAVPPRPGLYAVTGTMVARIPAYPGTSPWLRTTPPTAIVGHAIYIYDIK